MEKVEEADDAMEFEESLPEAAPKMAVESKPQKLTEDNLSRIGSSKAGSAGPKSQKSGKSVKSKASKRSKPAWATTEKQLEDEKEAEIDDLIEFAYDLDYE